MATKYKFLEASFHPVTRSVRIINLNTDEVWYYSHPCWLTANSAAAFEEVEIEALATYIVEFYSKATGL